MIVFGDLLPRTKPSRREIKSTSPEKGVAMEARNEASRARWCDARPITTLRCSNHVTEARIVSVKLESLAHQDFMKVVRREIRRWIMVTPLTIEPNPGAVDDHHILLR